MAVARRRSRAAPHVIALLAGVALAGTAADVELGLGGAVAGGLLLAPVDVATDGGAEATLVGVALGGMGGTLASVLLDPSEADAMLITTGAGLGIWSGAAIAAYGGGVDSLGHPNGADPLLGSYVGLLAGTAAGLGAAALIEVEPGQVALARTGMLWGTWYADLTHAWLPIDRYRPAHDRALLGTFVGGAVGAGAAALVRPQRWQVATVSAVGWAGVVGVALLEQRNDPARAGFNAAIYGIVPPVLAAASVPLVLLAAEGADVQVAASPGGVSMSGRW